MQDADVIRRRIGAALIDIGLVLVLLVLVARLFGNDEASNSSVRAGIQGRPQALFLLLTFAYFFGTEARWAQTLGKRLLGLRVVRVDGSTAKAGQIFVRNLVRIIDWLPALYLVGAAALFTTGERRQRLGDLAAGTRIVTADAIPPSPPPARPRPDEDDDVLARVLR
jgi:uncharacterized RDD family membrane protein YckC